MKAEENYLRAAGTDAHQKVLRTFKELTTPVGERDSQVVLLEKRNLIFLLVENAFLRGMKKGIEDAREVVRKGRVDGTTNTNS